MALYARNVEKRRILQDFRRHEEEVIGSLCRLSNRPVSPKTQMEQERRIRREIANSNERRRMQSINAGFQSLRTLLPHHAGEKLSKAAILQQTTQYIYQIEQEKTRLLTQNCQLKRLLNQQNQDSDGGSSSPDSPLPKRKKNDADSLSLDEVMVNASNESPNPIGNDTSAATNTKRIKQEVAELKLQLQQERRLRLILEEQTRNLESQLYPDKVMDMSSHQVHLQYQVSNSEHLADTSDRSRSASPTDRLKPTSPYSATPAPPPSGGVTSPAHVTHSSTLPVIATTASSAIHSAQESRVPPLGHQRSAEDLKIKAEHMSDSEDDDESVDAEDQCCRAHSRTVPRLPPPHGPAPEMTHLLPQPTRLGIASTSRQNLETIVEAIRHLEGDHLFNDDPVPRRTLGQLKSCGNSSISTSSYSPASPHSTSCPSETPLATSALVTVTSTDLSYRHHVIRPSRPGVIVSAHS